MSAKYARKEKWRKPTSSEMDIVRRYAQGARGKGILFFVPVLIIFIELIALELLKFDVYPLPFTITAFVITILAFIYFLAQSLYAVVKDAVKTSDIEVLDARVTSLNNAFFKYSGRTNVEVLVDGHIKKEIHVMNWNIRNIKVKDHVLLVRATNNKVCYLSICEGDYK